MWFLYFDCKYDVNSFNVGLKFKVDQYCEECLKAFRKGGVVPKPIAV